MGRRRRPERKDKIQKFHFYQPFRSGLLELIKFLQFLYSTVLSSNQTDEYLDLFNLSISTAYELLASYTLYYYIIAK